MESISSTRRRNPVHSPPPAHPASALLRQRNIDIAAYSLGGLIYVASIQWAKIISAHPLENVQRLGVPLLMFGLALWALTASNQHYLRWRNTLLMCFIVCLGKIPLFRSANGIITRLQVFPVEKQHGIALFKEIFNIFLGTLVLC